MRKSERIHDMLIYLNDKKSFQLKQIMERYAISKSTALRDIGALEEIGMPIYSRPGRNGHYGILPNRLLSPIVFTVDEVQAMYFSMQTLSAYQSTPFHLSVATLKQKFEGCISEERKKSLRKMELIFSLSSYQSNNECQYLDQILYMAIEEKVCKVRYTKGDTRKRYYVQFFAITSAYGQWYATAYNFQTQRPLVFRCDKIQTVESSDQYTAKPLADFLGDSRAMYREPDATHFKVEVSAKGVDQFHKEHYPSMELHHEQGKYIIRGFYNKGEERFIASYFLAYGEALTSVQPASLKKLMLERLAALSNRLQTI
ncbi:helix-turn-helix transcriptional regulator [Paenibacillus sanguinis]|uniref:helix-turn-helix transcriptional regulator n=1 Tax=Paenibacillus sanguinis TaxID=225906 RepID=UPI000368670A|nr:YafY family protein [Paenibacillus sanguinis]